MNTELACLILFILAHADLSAQLNKANLLTTDELLLHGKIVGLSADSIFFQQKKLGFTDAIDWRYVRVLTVRNRRDYRLVSVPLGLIIGIIPAVLMATLDQGAPHAGSSPLGLGGAVVGVAGGIAGCYFGYKLYMPKKVRLNSLATRII